MTLIRRASGQRGQRARPASLYCLPQEIVEGTRVPGVPVPTLAELCAIPDYAARLDAMWAPLAPEVQGACQNWADWISATLAQAGEQAEVLATLAGDRPGSMPLAAWDHARVRLHPVVRTDYHVWVRWQGRHYDALHLEGVEDWRDLFTWYFDLFHVRREDFPAWVAQVLYTRPVETVREGDIVWHETSDSFPADAAAIVRWRASGFNDEIRAARLRLPLRGCAGNSLRRLCH